ncbi:MAG: Fe(3+) ABC transporter substrate-binding protein [Alphaproteobacteria bacterium]|uniref:Iron ABC transporter substrate-binding protein n=1 Tax=Pseudorhizobium pelagicum TaxID=1509405 RepID=A0A922P6U6_9HYPH|nr:Fe(3+) ABC transporter substrate-binding protein [Pseudorhizobium pelagicum]MBU1314078.1 Fe(3+) ABC transporter substrate-binding protein [Alphaproteobacteria bacterium]KEQ09369.1 iron ABC transporter substrate-binding protein [Pseudorhizobium pelagicum]KEQ10811.1 iron ABC transporter substrate-binding protein [Pseudorhizobium pelagicum]MBU1552430.1 Fe(3+) ABC transporter substrate-binding protein [Alphaproteobacteria bacterium]MBU2339539.1 Fe(3+) ABC transporter substrate-binding protein [
MTALKGILAASALAGVSIFSVQPAMADGEVNIYSYRQPDLIKPLLDEFTKETGVATNVLFLDKGLVERIQAEGANSPADVILTVDIARVMEATEGGVTQPVTDNETINKDIPAQFRDPAGEWFALTTRGRVVYASKDRVEQDQITYEELADPKWKGRICIRDAQHSYNIGLIASMVAEHGEEYTETWLTGLKNNLARKPNGGDRDQAKAILAGECDIALGNTYYVGLMQTNEKEPEQKDWAAAIKVLFPNTEDRGTHVNISAMALAKNAPNKDNAVKLMEFLASGEAQKIYAEQVFEYPVMPGAEPSEIVKSFGTIKPDTLPLADIAANRKVASELVDKVGVNEGPEG